MTRGVSDTTNKLTESMTRYRDMVRQMVQKKWDQGPYLTQLNPRHKAREGIREMQALVDFSDTRESGAINLGHQGKRDKALAKGGGGMVGHRFKGICN